MGTTNSRDGIVVGLDESLYHSGPELSSTGARQILESPARFHYNQTHPQPHKDAFDLGTAVHTKVLGAGAGIEVLDYDSWRTAAAKADRDWHRSQGKIPMLKADMALIDAMAEAVLKHPTARVLFEQEGNAETSVFSTDPDTGVRQRARFDFLPNLNLPNPIAVDLKTSSKRVDQRGFERTVLDFQYEVQDAVYDDTLHAATGAHIPMVFVAVEVAAPHLVGIHQLDIKWREMGRDKAKRARETFAACTESGNWYGYPTDVQLSSPPVFAVYRHEEEYA